MYNVYYLIIKDTVPFLKGKADNREESKTAQERKFEEKSGC